MNKTELVGLVAEKAQVTKKEANDVICAFVDVVKDAVKSSDRVQMTGFGTFELREHGPRNGRNPATGEVISIPAKKAPAFKPGKEFKNYVED